MELTKENAKVGLLVKWINVFGVITNVHEEVYFSPHGESGDSWAITVSDIFSCNGEIIIDMDETYVEIVSESR